MKHNLKITLILLCMFVLTQFVSLFVINHYVIGEKMIPYDMDYSDLKGSSEITLISFVSSFAIAIFLIFILMKFKAKFVFRIWFLLVSVLALALTFNVFLSGFSNSALIALFIAFPIAIYKVYGRDFLVHNLSEIFIYPGIAAIFVSLLSLKGLIILLVLISFYDAWAVWKSGIMQKMAKFQMEEVKIFAGFYVPYLTKKQKSQVKKMKKEKSKKKIKVNVGILGGGDVVFSAISSGVVYKTWGLFPAIFVLIGSTLGLGYLLFRSDKKKFYPAMPFISAGIFLMMLIAWLIFIL